jgi:hypothetical protein
MRFRLHRIDTRRWKAVPDEANNRILFEPEAIEPDLKEIQERTLDNAEESNRFSALFLWAKNEIEHKKHDHEYYPTWSKALEEAKALYKNIQPVDSSDVISNFVILRDGSGITTGAAVFIRDYWRKLSDKDKNWCAKRVIQAVKKHADTDSSFVASDVLDHDGAGAAASVLPVLLDISDNDDERLEIKRLIITALTHANENVRLQAANGIRGHLWQRDQEFAEKCIARAIKYARFKKEHEPEIRQIYFGTNEDREAARIQWQAKKDAFRDQFARGELGNELKQITFATHSSRYILSPCLMIPDGSKETKHIELFSQMLMLFFAVEQNREKYYQGQDNTLEIDPKITFGFIQRFATYLYSLHPSEFQDYINLLKTGCKIAPAFTSSVLLHVALTSEQQEKKEVYWKLWKKLSVTVQQIALKKSAEDSSNREQGESRKLIRGMLHADTPWQKLDYKNQEMTLGKELLLEFAEHAGTNQDVFEALASLIYHFPKIFFEEGIHILARHQGKDKGNRLISRSNTAFYLENAIQRFLQIDHPGPLPRKMHDSCFTLLNALVETASSRAYYLREHLIRSRKVL